MPVEHARRRRMSEHEPRWIKARRSIGTGACVELAVDHDHILVRNSRDPEVHLRYTHPEIVAFFEAVRDQEFDHLLE
jgi:Domain of unknown function (DUF397)